MHLISSDHIKLNKKLNNYNTKKIKLQNKITNVFQLKRKCKRILERLFIISHKKPNSNLAPRVISKSIKNPNGM